MKKSSYILTAIFAACVTTHAVARPAYNWTGFYIGAHGGTLRGDYELPAAAVQHPHGGYGGIQAGYWAHLSPNWVYGFEADLSFADIGSTDSAVPLTLQIDRFGTARTRFGHAAGSWLFYASAGVAWAKLSTDTAFFVSRQPLVGWTAGLGAEYAFAPNWSVKAEYLFANLGSNTESILGFGGITQDVTFGTFRVGLNHRLGGAMPVTNATPRGRYNWTGAYIGVHGGYATGEQSMTYLGGTVPFEPDGNVGGFQGGYSFQFASNVVLGFESDFSFAGIKGHFMGDCCTVQIKQFGTARLRAGYAFDNFLLYATGGLAWAKTENDYLFSLFTTDRPFIGWAAGAGVEYALTPKWSVKAEWLRLKFDDNRTEFVGLTPFNERAEYDVYRVGLN